MNHLSPANLTAIARNGHTAGIRSRILSSFFSLLISFQRLLLPTFGGSLQSWEAGKYNSLENEFHQFSAEF